MNAKMNYEAEDQQFDTNLLAIAQAMHGELCGCGGCDMVNDLYNWLYNGDAASLTIDDVPALVAEWREYEGE